MAADMGRDTFLHKEDSRNLAAQFDVPQKKVIDRPKYTKSHCLTILKRLCCRMLVAFLGIALSLTDQTSRISVSTHSTVICDLAFTTASFSSVKVSNGAAIHVTGDGTSSMVTICGCLFLHNGISTSSRSSGGGAIYCKSTTVICEDTDFRTCRALSEVSSVSRVVVGRGGAIYADDDAPMNITYCNFTSCTCEGSNDPQYVGYWGGGALYSSSSKISAFNCTFENCEAKANYEDGYVFGGAIFGLEIECHWCNFLSCHASNGYGGYGGAISFGLTGMKFAGKSLTCEHCKFENCSAKWDGRVILINGVKSFLKQCTLSGSSDSGYGGIDIGWIRESASLDVSVSVVECTFEDCISRGEKNGHVIRITGLDTNTFVINLDTCTFVTTEESALLPTIWVKWAAGAANSTTFKMIGCTFIGQKKQCVHFTKNSARPYSGQWFLQGCKFIRNTVDDNGLFSFDVKAPSGARFVNCHFEDNIFTGKVNFTGPMIDGGSYSFEECCFSGWSCSVPVLFVPEGVKVASMTIIGCTFEECHSTESGVLGRFDDTNCALVMIEGTRFINCSSGSFILEVAGSNVKGSRNSEASCVNLTNCTFLECHVGSGKNSLSVCNVVSITSVTCICICDSVFEHCSSSSGAVVSLECDLVSMARDTISCAGFGLSVSVSSGESRFEDIEFHRLSGVSCEHAQCVLSCPSGVFLRFYNCCFTHTRNTGECGVFLDVNVSGTIVFSRVCFDAVRDDSVSLDLIDGGNITFDGEESNFFGECECWGDQSTDPETTLSSFVESFYDESSVSDSFYDESSVSDSFSDESSVSDSFYDESSVSDSSEGDDDGEKGDTDNTALVIGIVVAVSLVVIACVVVLVIFLIRRGRDWATSSEPIVEEDHEIDTTEETVDAIQSDLCVTEADITITDDDAPAGSPVREGEPYPSPATLPLPVGQDDECGVSGGFI